MPPKRPSPNKPKPPSSKKPRKPPADKKDPSRQDEEGPREEWGPVPEYLHYESPYPPGRNMHKIRELYATHAGERPYVAPWVHFGESLSNPWPSRRTPEDHLVQAVCSVDPNIRERVAVLGPQAAWMGPHGAWEEGDGEGGRQYVSDDQAASGPSGQSQQLYQQQQQQSAPTSAKGKEKSSKSKGKEIDRGHGGGHKGGRKR